MPQESLFGIAIFFEPTNGFYSFQEPLKYKENERKGVNFLYRYLKPFKGSLINLIIGIFLSALFNLAFPILTQKIVDVGIGHKNIGFVYLILLAEVFLFIGITSVEIIKSWIILHMNTRINISIISDFLTKLMKLPIYFFEGRLLTDIMQRIGDHYRIQRFLTQSSLDIILSLTNFIIFTIILAFYSIPIFGLFVGGSILSVAWVMIFLRKRARLDYNRFELLSDNSNSLYECINGMKEIKLNNCSTYKRWEWERVQVKLFKLNVSTLSLEQYQQVGNRFFTQLKNILIIFIAAISVIKASMTLGEMLAISYIIGQLNGPINQFIDYVKSLQDAKLSSKRLQEIHNKEEEYQSECVKINKDFLFDLNEITINHLSFQYGDPRSPFVLKDISLSIPIGKTTAIVGVSGSGKTTLMKLLLKFYSPQIGNIYLGHYPFEDINTEDWRKKCGVVLDDGYIFSDSIANNIALSSEKVDFERLAYSCEIANIKNFILSLPNRYNTKIGEAGVGISKGQRQRILIARAVYKDPEILFFDEATSTLDANTERAIIENLDEFLSGRTAIIIAHRLSTVKNADQIAVMDDGRIIETGNHKSLLNDKNHYYQLVKNQLELGT